MTIAEVMKYSVLMYIYCLGLIHMDTAFCSTRVFYLCGMRPGGTYGPCIRSLLGWQTQQLYGSFCTKLNAHRLHTNMNVKRSLGRSARTLLSLMQNQLLIAENLTPVHLLHSYVLCMPLYSCEWAAPPSFPIVVTTLYSIIKSSHWISSLEYRVSFAQGTYTYLP